MRRRKRQRHHAQAVEEVVEDAPGLDVELQVGMCGRCESHG